MPLYESLLQRLQLLPLSVTFFERPLPAPHLCVLAHSTAGTGTSRVSTLFYAVHSRFSSASYLV
jgi:hypothetical protein